MAVTYTLTDGVATLNLQIVADGTYGFTSQIQSFKVSKEAITTEVPIPTQDADKTIIIDAMGCKRSYTLSGITSGTVTQVDNFIDVMDGFLDSNQMFVGGGSLGGLTFATGADSLPASLSTKVILRSFDYEWETATVAKIEWNIQLIQGNN